MDSRTSGFSGSVEKGLVSGDPESEACFNFSLNPEIFLTPNSAINLYRRSISLTDQFSA